MGNITEFITDLNNSPMFHLSLSSKELFHSNLLAWLAEDSDTRDLFVGVLELFGLKHEQAIDLADGIRKDKYMVLREYKNFDFCICEKLKNWKEDSDEEYVPGQVVLVLENKFKSIPYEKQLKEYIEKVIKLNGEDRNEDRIEEAQANCKIETKCNIKSKCNIKPKCKAEYLPYMDYSNMNCHFVLLTLNKDICGLPLDDQKKSFRTPKLPIWHVVSYKEYAEKLFGHAEDKQDFKHQIIKDYAGYVNKFCDYINPKLQELESDDLLKQNWNKVLCPNKELLSIRMDDIWQKLVANIVLKQLRLKAEDFLKNEKTGQVLVGAGFSRGTALIEIKIHIGDECLFGVQIQNGLYKRFLEAPKVEKDEDKRIAFYKDKLDKLQDLNLFRYNNSNWEDAVGDVLIDGDVSPKAKKKDGTFKKGKAGMEGFGGYGTTFLAQWKAITEDATVEKVIEHIIADCSNVKNVK